MTWQNQRSVLYFTPLAVSEITAQNSSVRGDGVRISQYVEMLTAPINVNQEKRL